jgi:hypothetical protein
VPLFPALQVLHDPQGFADKMFKKLKACADRYAAVVVPT